MPVQVPQWTEYLNCPVCYSKYNDSTHLPVSLGCSHTLCKSCLTKLHQKRCPLDQSSINKSVDVLPGNSAIIQLVGGKVTRPQNIATLVQPENEAFYFETMKFVEDLGIYLQNASTSTQAPPETSGTNGSSTLSRPMQRKLVSLINCQLVEEEGRARAMRAARSLGERTVTELILHHQNPQQLSANLWASVRARGCQFLGPAMQEEVLRLILLALEDGSALSRKVLVLFVVQRLEPQYPHASKTAIGHVVQLLYRASCFKVTKRDEESSLMQLKEEFRTYETLRREHDSQIVQIATEAGLRIAPEQWSSLLYGDTNHKSHMQSIIDKLQTPQSFAQSVDELVIALQRTGDPGNLSHLRVHLDLLANIDPGPDTLAPSWENLEAIIKSTFTIVKGLVEFIHTNSLRKYDPPNIHGSKYKTSMCRDFIQKKTCPRGVNCTFAHSEDEMERYRAKNRRSRLQTKQGGYHDDMDEFSDIMSNISLSLSDAVDADRFEAKPERTESARNLPHSESSSKNGASVEKNLDLVSSSDMTIEQARNVSLLRPGRDFPSQEAPSLPRRQGPPELHSTRTPGMLASPGYPAPRYPSTERFNAANIIARGLHQQAPSQYHPSLYDETYRYPSRYVRPPQYTGEQYYRSLAQYGNRGVPRDYLAPLRAPPVPLQRSTYRYPQGAPPRSHILEDLYQQREELLAHLNRSTPPPSGHVDQRLNANGPGAISSNVISQRIRTDTLSGTQRLVTSAELARSISDTAGTIQVNSSLAKIKDAEEKEKEEERCETKEGGPVASIYCSWSQGNDASLGYESENDSETSAFDYKVDKYPVHTSIVSSSSSLEAADYRDVSLSGSLSEADESAGCVSACEDDEESFSEAELAKFWATVASEEDDSFIPFTDRPIVSKYGPISRSARAKVKSTAPVNATATQEMGTTPVTAVTPMERPYPITSQVPSRYVSNANTSPAGQTIARSLPTAEMKLGSILSTQPYSVHAIRQRVENLPTDHVPGPPSTAEREQLRSELERLDHKILLITEDEAMVHQQLQTVEMNIQAESGMMPLPPGHPYLSGMFPRDFEQSYDPRFGGEQGFESQVEPAYDPRTEVQYDACLLPEQQYDPRQPPEQRYDPGMDQPVYNPQFSRFN
ncbi:roquin-1-like isoform X2 [Lineus longissimus]|uniref:roquin-1-like isoform X2 n=1 Tax=Lineus longissimus TaxID=88925 RepID=UPI00315CFA47